MSDKSVVGLVEEWQTGFYLVIGSIIAGTIFAYLLSPIQPPYGGLLGFLSGIVVAFLAFSYYLYGN